MAFKKGETGNPNGRPSDPNVKLLREGIREKLVTRIPELFVRLDEMKESKDYVDAFIRIAKEVLPALPAELPALDGENSNIISVFKYIEEQMKGDLKKVG